MCFGTFGGVTNPIVIIANEGFWRVKAIKHPGTGSYLNYIDDVADYTGRAESDNAVKASLGDFFRSHGFEYTPEVINQTSIIEPETMLQ